MGIKDKIIYTKDVLGGISGIIKDLILILGTLIIVIAILSIVFFLITPYPEPDTTLLRKTAFNRACEIWNLTYSCKSEVYEKPIILYTDVDDEWERVYSVKDFCVLLKLNSRTCHMRCGCPFALED